MKLRVELLGDLVVRVGEERTRLCVSSSRLLALLALASRPVSRSRAAGTLWPERPEERALANLRLAVFRIPPPFRSVVASTRASVGLDPTTAVDVWELEAQARRILRRTHEPADLTVASLRRELLPDWDEEWVASERTRLDALRVHALQELSRLFAAAGRAVDAIEAALAAVAVDPLNEAATRALVDAHLLDANPAEAARTFEGYRSRVHHELGIAPSPDFDRRMRDAIVR